MKLILSDRRLELPELQSDVRLVDLSEAKIANCVGCFGCWTKAPGKCVIRDDAASIYPLIAKSDEIVYVSKVKYGSWDTVMKTMLERAIPVQQALIRILDGETHHVQRAVVAKKATVIGYGDLSDREKALFSALIERNSRNMSFERYNVVFAQEADVDRVVEKEVLPWLKQMIINASPRAPRSNSKRYAELFELYCRSETEYFALTKGNHLALCQAIEGFDNMLVVFPLYADAIPSSLLGFLKTLEENPPGRKPTRSVLVNCGFIEPEQNDVAVEMVRLFCEQNGYPFGSSLKIGSGEAILDTPFRILVTRAVKRLARSIDRGEAQHIKTRMPLPKRLFIAASTKYWEGLGHKNGITHEQMATKEIEGCA